MKNWRQPIVLLIIFLIVGTGLPSGASAQAEKSSIASSTITTKKADAADFVKSAAYEWLDVALEATAREHERVAPRPTVGSRMLMIITTAMYDAWAAYDEKAFGTRLGDKLRRPKAERTEKNKRAAIAFATYRAMLDMFSEDKVWLYEQMRQRGFDPNDTTTDLSKPQGVGNVAAAVIEYRHTDGLETGAYGFGFTDDGKFSVSDIGGKKLLSVDAAADKNLKRPRPLMMMNTADGLRLYSGRSYAVVTIK